MIIPERVIINDFFLPLAMLDLTSNYVYLNYDFLFQVMVVFIAYPVCEALAGKSNTRLWRMGHQ